MTTKIKKPKASKTIATNAKKQFQAVKEHYAEINKSVDEREQRRKALLGNLDAFIDWPSDMEAGKRLEALKDRARTAKRLHALTGGKLSMRFHPSVFIGDDRENSLGHQFCGSLEDKNECAYVYIDGRDGNMGKQLFKELERIAAIYSNLAKEVKGKIVAKGVHRSLVVPTAPLPPEVVSSSTIAKTTTLPTATKRASGSKKSRAS